MKEVILVDGPLDKINIDQNVHFKNELYFTNILLHIYSLNQCMPHANLNCVIYEKFQSVVFIFITQSKLISLITFCVNMFTNHVAFLFISL
jgi:hypothetical protein